jgi:hypothetical protein
MKKANCLLRRAGISVEKTDRAPNGCILWNGSKTRQGYGRTKRKNYGQIYVHRLVWSIANGEIPDNMKICHKCDNPSCININHLFMGTQKENIQDAITKGRFHQFCKKGENRLGNKRGAGKRKLLPADVVSIVNGPETYVGLSKKYGVSTDTIWRVKKRITYKVGAYTDYDKAELAAQMAAAKLNKGAEDG